MSHITTCTTCGKLYEEFIEECASDPNKRECGTCWMKRKKAEYEAVPRSTHGVWRDGEWLPCYCLAGRDHGIGSEQLVPACRPQINYLTMSHEYEG